jgi:hypothetical protein
MPREIVDFGRTMDAASLRYAAATERYESLQLEFNVACRLRNEIQDTRGRVFAFRFVGCHGISVVSREWGGAGWRVAKEDELPLIEALHADALKPLTVDYFLMKSAAELSDAKPHLAGGRWLRGAFERFEAAVDRGALCFWLKAGGAGPSSAPLDCRIILACEEYRIFGFDGEVRPEEFAAIGRRWWSAWREYWDRRKRGEGARDAEFEWTQPYIE